MITARYYSNSKEPHMNEAVGVLVENIIWQGKASVGGFCSTGIFEDGALVGGVLYHNYHPNEQVIEMTAASLTKKWLTRPTIRAILNLPFKLLDCQMCVLRVSEKNTHMLRIAKAIGFSETIIPRLRGRDEAEHIFTLTDDQWQSSKYYEEAA